MAKNAKNASKAQAEGLKYVPMRKAARAMTFVAGVAEAAWAWAAVFAAMTAVAFYLAYAMTIDLHEAH